MGLVSKDDGWRIPDWLWEQMEPLLPAPPPHPLGCHRVPDRDALDAILLVLRTGMQWNALNATGICSYDADTMRELVAGHGFTAHIRSRGEEIDLKERKPDWKARRWVVEACHSWLNRNRGILIRWSKKDLKISKSSASGFAPAAALRSTAWEL